MPQSISPGLTKEAVLQALNDLTGSLRERFRLEPSLFRAAISG